MPVHLDDQTKSAHCQNLMPNKCWKIHAITFNVNNQLPNGESVKQWLDSDCAGVDGHNSHIVCIALQELPFAHMFRVANVNNNWTLQITSWMNAQNLALASELYVASNALLIFFSWSILNMVDNIEDRWLRNSLFGKGTISTKVAFRNDFVLVFVTSHFFAGTKYVRERIKQYEVGRRCTFPEEKSAKKFIIWQGDLNSRMEGIASAEQLIHQLNSLDGDEIKSELGHMLQSHDQLTKARANGEVFDEYTEAEIEFKPTYRLLISSGAYDPLRVPSWCDRILFNGDMNLLRITKYSSCRTITLSDHYPVSAQLELHINTKEQQEEKNQQLGSQTMAFLEAQQELRQPPSCTVRVEYIPTWEELIPLVCRVVIPNDIWTNWCSYRDWVGIYPDSMTSVSKPLEWMYTFVCATDDEWRITSERTLIVEFQPLKSGRYRVGYFSIRKKCLLAFSNPFFIRKAF